jgi:ubiquinone/menaquinone biosynthesis C-methylase UbiE
MLQQVADEFDQWAEQGRAESMAKGHSSVTFQLLDRLTFESHMKVADIGCGNGWAVEEMIRRGAGSGVGIDLSPGMIEIGNKNASESAQYFVSTGAKLPMESNTIDFILSVESLYYHPSPLESLLDWKRVLRKGGEVAIMVDLYLENIATHAWVDALSIPVHLLSIEEYISLFTQAGFTNVKAEQLQNTDPIKSREEFKTSPYWPSYESYLSYRQIGSLIIQAS